MELVDRALSILEHAEKGLRELMLHALAETRYAELAEIAPLADALARLSRPSPDLRAVDSAPSPRPSNGRAAPSKRLGRATPVAGTQRRVGLSRMRGTTEYPRFERDGDKLVKIGWSKRDRGAYEHRAPRDVVFSVGQRLMEEAKPDGSVSMERVLPVKTAEGVDIPSYQAYLALAWFRAIGAVERTGKDGYAIRDRSLQPDRLEADWQSLIARP